MATNVDHGLAPAAQHKTVLCILEHLMKKTSTMSPKLRAKGVIKNYGTGGILLMSAMPLDEILIVPDEEVGKRCQCAKVSEKGQLSCRRSSHTTEERGKVVGRGIEQFLGFKFMQPATINAAFPK